MENRAEAQAAGLGRVFGGVSRPEAVRSARGRSAGGDGKGRGWGRGWQGGQGRAETHCLRKDAGRD